MRASVHVTSVDVFASRGDNRIFLRRCGQQRTQGGKTHKGDHAHERQIVVSGVVSDIAGENNVIRA